MAIVEPKNQNRERIRGPTSLSWKYFKLFHACSDDPGRKKTEMG